MLIDRNTGPWQMIAGTQQTVWNSDDDLWYDSWVSPSGVRLYRPALAFKQPDGSWAVGVVDEYSDTPLWWAPVVIDEPQPEPEAVTGLSVADFLPDDVQKVKNAAAFVKSPKRMMGSLLYREPDHGHWYQSGWMWFFLGVTAMMAFIWNGPMNMPAEMNNGEWTGAGFAYFVWLFVGWMPLAASGIGALQKAGYKRLAAAYSVMLFALFTWFFHSQLKNSENNG